MNNIEIEIHKLYFMIKTDPYNGWKEWESKIESTINSWSINEYNSLISAISEFDDNYMLDQNMKYSDIMKYFYQSKFFINTGDWLKAEKYLLKIIKSNKDKIKIKALKEYGDLLLKKGEHKKSFKIYNQAQELYIETKNDKRDIELEYGIYHGLGGVCHITGKFKKGISYYIKCHEIYSETKMNDEWKLMNIFNNIGLMYLSLNNLKDSEIYFTKGINSGENTKMLSTLHRDISRVYIKQKKLDLAEKNLRISLEKSTLINDLGGMASTNFILGQYYLQKLDIMSAMQSFNNSLELIDGGYFDKYLKLITLVHLFIIKLIIKVDCIELTETYTQILTLTKEEKVYSFKYQVGIANIVLTIFYLSSNLYFYALRHFIFSIYYSFPYSINMVIHFRNIFNLKEKYKK